MWPSFWKACLISLAVYSGAVLIGLWMGLWLIFLIVPVFQFGWGAFCLIRIIQLRRGGGHKQDGAEWDRETYSFSLGGLTSSCTLFVLIVAMSQILTK